MGKYKVLIGDKIGRLIVLKEVEPRIRTNGRKRRIILVLCECGKEREVMRQHLVSGHTRSCGCLMKENNNDGNNARKYKHSNHPLYKVFEKMKERCYSKTSKTYKYYGGRGIVICDQWLNNYDEFYEWSISDGYKRGLQIDRIDNNGNYEPSNCRWVDCIVNANNKRNNIYVEYKGEKDSFRNMLRKLGIFDHRIKVYKRIRRGKTFDEAIINL